MQATSDKSINEYFKIRIDTLRAELPIPFDLFFKTTAHMVTYLRAGDHLNAEKFKTLLLKDSGQHFYLLESDRWAYRHFMKEQIQIGSLSSSEKAHLLRASALGFIEEMFEQPDVHKALDDAKPLIQDFVDVMESDPATMADLISLSSHDFYTYNHSLDVSIYSLALAKTLGFDRPHLEELGLGALFHDIGKRLVKLEILLKQGALDEPEWDQMQRHPQFGLEILVTKPNITPGIIAACFEHHESWAGNGYPQKLAGDEIHPYGRIIAITDTFDAMTTKRSYNTPMTPQASLEMMRDKLKGRYDPEMIKAMTHVLFTQLT